jgi:hypothetical protein
MFLSLANGDLPVYTNNAQLELYKEGFDPSRVVLANIDNAAFDLNRKFLISSHRKMSTEKTMEKNDHYVVDPASISQAQIGEVSHVRNRGYVTRGLVEENYPLIVQYNKTLTSIDLNLVTFNLLLWGVPSAPVYSWELEVLLLALVPCPFYLDILPPDWLFGP